MIMFTNKMISKEWDLKRKEILKRDNFTCQNCQTFNPSLGMVEVIHPIDQSLDLHEFKSDYGHNTYFIASSRKGVSFEINFDFDWIVFPVLHIHHKRYIDNRKPWEYDDGELITLCKHCHTALHSDYEIPVYDENKNFKELKKFSPEDLGSGRNHDFEPWMIIQSNVCMGKSEVSSFRPSLNLFITKEEGENLEDYLNECAFIMQDFFRRYLPRYKLDNT